MEQFNYRTCYKSGKIFSVKGQVINISAVINSVRVKFNKVFSLKKVSRFMGNKIFSPSQKLTFKESGIFFRQLAILLNSGISLIKALNIVKGKVKEYLRNICSLIEKEIKRGCSFSKALEKFPEHFSITTRQIVAAGELSGNLPIVLIQLADMYEQEENLIRAIKNACIYPGLVLVLAIGTLVFFFLNIVPMLLEVYKSLNVEKTSSLVAVNFLSNLLVEYKFACILGMLLCIITILNTKKTLFKFFLGLPGFRASYLNISEVRFCKILGIMLKSGITLPLALYYAKETLSSMNIKEQIEKLTQRVLQGKTLSQSAEMYSKFFSTTTVEYINIGENSGTLADMLLEAAKVVESQLQDKIKKMQALIEPLMMLIAATFVGVIVFAVTAPLFGLVSAMPMTP